MKQSRVKADFALLNEFIKNVGADLVVRVGIIGADADKKYDDGLTMAENGLIQELGSLSRNIPPRSFLRMPIETRQATIIQQMIKIRTKVKMEQGDIRGIYNDLGIAAVNVVQGAFSTAGFGSWPANADSTVAAKGSSKPLIDEGELRRSISFDIVKRSDL